MSGFATTTYGALVAATPLFTFAAKPSAASLTISVRVRLRRRRVGDDDELVDLRAQRRHGARELGVGAVRDDDTGDAHVSSR